MKKFTVPLIGVSQRVQRTLYIGEPLKTLHPIIYQMRWYLAHQQLACPPEIIQSLKDLHKLALKNDVGFVDLCQYALGDDNDDASLSNKPPSSRSNEEIVLRVACPFQITSDLFCLDQEDDLNLSDNSFLDKINTIRQNFRRFLRQNTALADNHYANLLAALIKSDDSDVDQDKNDIESLLRRPIESQSVRVWYPLVDSTILIKDEYEDEEMVRHFKCLLIAAAYGCVDAEYRLAVILDVHYQKHEVALNTAMEEIYNSVTPNDSFTFVMSGFLYYFTNTEDKPDQYNLALDQLRLAESLGSAAACHHLGRMHQSGYGVPCDQSFALVHFTKAATLGNPYTCFLLGNYREYGLHGLAANQMTAVEYYLSSNAFVNAETHYRVADCYQQSEKDQQAEFHAFIALVLFRDIKLIASNSFPFAQYSLPALLQKLGNILNGAGRLVEALHCFNECVRLMPSDVSDWERAELLIDRAELLTKFGYYYSAIKDLRTADKLLPNNRRTLDNLSFYYCDCGRFSEGFKWINQAIEMDPMRATPHNTKGAYLVFLGRYDEAMDALYKAVRINANYVISYGHLLKIFYAFGDLQEIRKILVILKSHQSMAMIRYVYLYMLTQLEGNILKGGAYKRKALSCLTKLNESDRDAYCYAKNANNYYCLNEFTIALIFIREAINRNDQFFVSYVYLGNILTKLGRYIEALTMYDKALDLVERKIPYITLNKAHCLYKFDKPAEAEVLVDEVRRDEPRLVQAHYLKAKLCYKRGDMQRAIEANLTLLRRCPTHHKALKLQAKLTPNTSHALPTHSP